jgi:hypothetical protein
LVYVKHCIFKYVRCTSLATALQDQIGNHWFFKVLKDIILTSFTINSLPKYKHDWKDIVYASKAPVAGHGGAGLYSKLLGRKKLEAHCSRPAWTKVNETLSPNQTVGSGACLSSQLLRRYR